MCICILPAHMYEHFVEETRRGAPRERIQGRLHVPNAEAIPFCRALTEPRLVTSCQSGGSSCVLLLFPCNIRKTKTVMSRGRMKSLKGLDMKDFQNSWIQEGVMITVIGTAGW